MEKDNNVITEDEFSIEEFIKMSKVGQYDELRNTAYSKLDNIRSDKKCVRNNTLYNTLSYFENKLMCVKQKKEIILSIIIPIEILLLTLILSSGILSYDFKWLSDELEIFMNIVGIMILVGALSIMVMKEYPWKEELYYNYYVKLIRAYNKENKEYVIKEFKIKNELAEKFDEFCKKAEISQTDKISELIANSLNEETSN